MGSPNLTVSLFYFFLLNLLYIYDEWSSMCRQVAMIVLFRAQCFKSRETDVFAE